MNSMTGFGKGESISKIGKFTLEISSVNNRFLEISTRLPRQYSLLEHRLRELVSAKLTRGKISVYVGFEESEAVPGKYLINKKAAQSYLQQLTEVKKELRLGGEIDLHDLLLLPEVSQVEPESLDNELVWSGMKKAADQALVELSSMRRREGAAMARDMNKRLRIIHRLVKKITKASKSSVEKYRRKLSARIEELLHSKEVDPERLELEVALFAERSDISEECTRLMSHIEQYQKSINLKEPVGKRLTFILQEMNREANTIGAKCSDAEIASAVITLKEELEKLRELAQNVE
ncbi:MAG: YicC/YloC family endoribonuclease [Candidatus Zixiibacteriota bacterium]